MSSVVLPAEVLEYICRIYGIPGSTLANNSTNVTQASWLAFQLWNKKRLLSREFQTLKSIRCSYRAALVGATQRCITLWHNVVVYKNVINIQPNTLHCLLHNHKYLFICGCSHFLCCFSSQA